MRPTTERLQDNQLAAVESGEALAQPCSESACFASEIAQRLIEWRDDSGMYAPLKWIAKVKHIEEIAGAEVAMLYLELQTGCNDYYSEHRTHETTDSTDTRQAKSKFLRDRLAKLYGVNPGLAQTIQSMLGLRSNLDLT